LQWYPNSSEQDKVGEPSVARFLLGRGVSAAGTVLLQWPILLSLSAIVASVAVSVTFGIVFDYDPTWKASRLDPIAALRYE
jgi:ABC-type antimicrobial peptide transport system permease subunit